MSVVLVTPNMYLIASKILHITMDEHVNYIEVRQSTGKFKTHFDKYFNINIIYETEVVSNQNPGFGGKSHSGDTRECSIEIRGATNAHKMFNNMIEQIRNQMPDVLFLNQAVEALFNQVDTKFLEDKDQEKVKMNYDADTKKVRRAGKAKRAGKAVLRKSKSSR